MDRGLVLWEVMFRLGLGPIINVELELTELRYTSTVSSTKTQTFPGTCFGRWRISVQRRTGSLMLLGTVESELNLFSDWAQAQDAKVGLCAVH